MILFQSPDQVVIVRVAWCRTYMYIQLVYLADSASLLCDCVLLP